MRATQQPAASAPENPPERTGSGAPGIVGVGTAVPPTSYTQEEILDTFGITDRRIRAVFLGGAIERRNLTLPPAGPDGLPPVESQGELLSKHTASGLRIGRDAVEHCLKDAGAALGDVRYLCCVTSTGLLTPDSPRSSSRTWVSNSPASVWTSSAWAVTPG